MNLLYVYGLIITDFPFNFLIIWIEVFTFQSLAVTAFKFLGE